MKNIFEPSDVDLIPEKSDVEPNVEITDGLRLHFHRNGVTFGLVDPGDSRFSLLIDYKRARRMMFAAAGVSFCEELETEEPAIKARLQPDEAALILGALRARFPWLWTDESVSGADVVDTLNQWREELETRL